MSGYFVCHRREAVDASCAAMNVSFEVVRIRSIVRTDEIVRPRVFPAAMSTMSHTSSGMPFPLLFMASRCPTHPVPLPRSYSLPHRINVLWLLCTTNRNRSARNGTPATNGNKKTGNRPKFHVINTTHDDEKSFRKHYRSWVIPRIRVGVQIQMALHLLFGSLELLCGYTAGAVMGVLGLRLAIMVSLTAFSWMTLDKKFHKIMDALTLGFYTVSQSGSYPRRNGLRVMFGVVLVCRCTCGVLWRTLHVENGATLALMRKVRSQVLWRTFSHFCRSCFVMRTRCECVVF